MTSGTAQEFRFRDIWLVAYGPSIVSDDPRTTTWTQCAISVLLIAQFRASDAPTRPGRRGYSVLTIEPRVRAFDAVCSGSLAVVLL